jgi:3-isopropylmalate dehydratase small subunit
MTFYLHRIRKYEIFKMYFSRARLYMPPAQHEENKPNSKDEDIIVVEEEDNIGESKEENHLTEEGIKMN